MPPHTPRDSPIGDGNAHDTRERPTEVNRDSEVTEELDSLRGRLRSAQQLALSAAFANEELMTVLDSVSDACLVIDRTWQISYLNLSAASLCGQSVDALRGSALWEALTALGERHTREQLDQAMVLRIPVVVEWFPATEVCYELRAFPTARGLVLYLRDVTQRKALERQLEQHALADPLTGMPNRTLLLDRLDHTRAQAHGAGQQTAVLALDLDGFQRVNDSLGRSAADEILRQMAERLTAALDSSQTVARVGADEFTIVLSPVQHAGDALTIAEHLRNAVARPIAVAGHDVVITASVGITLSTDPASPTEDILRQAETALSRAKAAGRNCAVLFDDQMQTAARARLALEYDLRQAIEHQEFSLDYQPTVAIATGQVVAMEALVRWQHPQRGQIGPASFIPLAEETGLIVPLGHWVLATACRDAAAWQHAVPGQPALSVSVNLSARQFRQVPLSQEVAQILADAVLAPELLILELTESVVMEQAETTVTRLTELRNLGVRLAIDDFGTGYSSLAYLKRFPVDLVKIDRTFIGGLPDDREDRLLVAGMIGLAHALGLTVVAEGVETTAQLVELERLGCDLAQGYQIARPLPGPAALARARQYAAQYAARARSGNGWPG